MKKLTSFMRPLVCLMTASNNLSRCPSTKYLHTLKASGCTFGPLPEMAVPVFFCDCS
eukprot:CAMPEP_0177268114 /NCGR_PEP_ID=MMETSP0367-20130122/63631_1 /TAXON_ID=447022 ORGANISM="Scrippsiella hangoei-like, Strain SHHI-4" /NCGR_SAMPLE_ID=MMETSP0367 /ASSEMBLY_ACC=CAM_ASM_000362 /LENGTH=56 /DNA_ID=CAMNT_0018723701 /DNA_START=40 /DNA_END=207 /DNA_ORIENTATION=+